MKKLRFFLALYMSKLAILMLKITKHKGTNFPGKLALKICPMFLKYVSKPKTTNAVNAILAINANVAPAIYVP